MIIIPILLLLSIKATMALPTPFPAPLCGQLANDSTCNGCLRYRQSTNYATEGRFCFFCVDNVDMKGYCIDCSVSCRSRENSRCSTSRSSCPAPTPRPPTLRPPTPIPPTLPPPTPRPPTPQPVFGDPRPMTPRPSTPPMFDGDDDQPPVDTPTPQPVRGDDDGVDDDLSGTRAPAPTVSGDGVVTTGGTRSPSASDDDEAMYVAIALGVVLCLCLCGILLFVLLRSSKSRSKRTKEATIGGGVPNAKMRRSRQSGLRSKRGSIGGLSRRSQGGQYMMAAQGGPSSYAAAQARASYSAAPAQPRIPGGGGQYAVVHDINDAAYGNLQLKPPNMPHSQPPASSQLNARGAYVPVRRLPQDEPYSTSPLDRGGTGELSTYGSLVLQPAPRAPSTSSSSNYASFNYNTQSTNSDYTELQVMPESSRPLNTYNFNAPGYTSVNNLWRQ